MSAIGDYVHLTYDGYVKKTGYQREPYKDGAQASIQARERQYNS